jgi:hypothetical protein
VFDVVEPMKCIVSTNLNCFLESNLFYKFGDILSSKNSYITQILLLSRLFSIGNLLWNLYLR